jgi:hypothetical protein
MFAPFIALSTINIALEWIAASILSINPCINCRCLNMEDENIGSNEQPHGAAAQKNKLEASIGSKVV